MTEEKEKIKYAVAGTFALVTEAEDETDARNIIAELFTQEGLSGDVRTSAVMEYDELLEDDSKIITISK